MHPNGGTLDGRKVCCERTFLENLSCLVLGQVGKEFSFGVISEKLKKSGEKTKPLPPTPPLGQRHHPPLLWTWYMITHLKRKS